jgi:uncharacterized protein YkvS
MIYGGRTVAKIQTEIVFKEHISGIISEINENLVKVDQRQEEIKTLLERNAELITSRLIVENNIELMDK